MAKGSYKQFCPVAMASEIVYTRWTAVLVRELLLGSTRFNDLRRGVPRMSPALLSKRLKDLEEAGILYRSPVKDEPDIEEYILTQAGKDLYPVIEALGVWGTRWVETEPTLENLDPNLLMWDMRRNMVPDPKPKKEAQYNFFIATFPNPERTGGSLLIPQMIKLIYVRLSPVLMWTFMCQPIFEP